MNRRGFVRLALVSAGAAALPGSVRLTRRAAPAEDTGALPPARRQPPPQPRAPRRPAPVALRELDDRVVLSNEAGDWVVWKRLTRSADGTRVVGPGYVGRLERPHGLPPLVDDFRAPGPINDPRFGGLGAFGWHHARAGQGSWDMDSRVEAATNGGFGVARAYLVEPAAVAADGSGRVGIRVEFRDGWQDPVMAITYRYLVIPRAVLCLIDVEQRWEDDGHGQAFVKEPKVVTAVAPAYSTVAVYDRTGTLLRRIDLDNLSEPWMQTAQIGARDRRGVSFTGNTPLSVTMQAWNGSRTLPWYGSGAGLDGWAQAAQGRLAYSQLSAPYCLARSGLRRRWEVAARTENPALSCLFHGWEGGSGLTDCMDASRTFGPAGETWSLVATYAL